MEFLTTILLALALILLVTQAVLIYKQQRKHQELVETYHGLKRALQISDNKFLDSERERGWLNNQIGIMLDEQKRGVYIHDPALEPSWNYNEGDIIDPRD